MGMVTVLRCVDDDTIAQLQKHPQLIHRLLSEEEDSDDPAASPPGFFARLLGRTTPPPIVLEREPGDEADLDKAWNAIHFMLTGVPDETTHPLGFIFNGGATVGDEEIGYGPARAFPAEATQTIANLIGAISREEFLGRYNAPAMLRAKVYPEPLWAPDRADEHNEVYVADNFELLRAFLLAAAAAKKGFLIFLT